jgi:hypothetical protein
MYHLDEGFIVLRKAIEQAWALPPALKTMMGDYRPNFKGISLYFDFQELVEGFIPATLDTETQLDAWVASEVARRNIVYAEGYEHRASIDMRLLHAQECPMKYNWRTFFLMLYDGQRDETTCPTCTAPVFQKEEDRGTWDALAAVVLREYDEAAMRTFAVLGWKVFEKKVCERIGKPFVDEFRADFWDYKVLEYQCQAGNVYVDASLTMMTSPDECVPCIFTATLTSVLIDVGQGRSYQVPLNPPPFGKSFLYRCTFSSRGSTLSADMLCQHQQKEDFAYLLHAIRLLNAATRVGDVNSLFDI